MEEQNVVIDIGSFSTKSGFAGFDNFSVTSSSVEFLKHPKIVWADEKQERTKPSKHLKTKVYPIESGEEVNWNIMTQLLENVFYETMGIHVSEKVVLMSDLKIMSKSQVAILTQIFFETFSVPAFALESQSILTLLSTGRSDGSVLDCGYTVTQISNCQNKLETKKNIYFSGRDISRSIQDRLESKGYILSIEEVRNIKETYCYVNYPLKKVKNEEISKIVKLPDGQSVELRDERFECIENLFCVNNRNQVSLQSAVVEIMKKNIYFDRSLIISGGSSLLEGFGARLGFEVNKLDLNTDVDIVKAKENSVWVGGSILASMSTFDQTCMTSEDYDEQGPSGIRFKYQKFENLF